MSGPKTDTATERWMDVIRVAALSPKVGRAMEAALTFIDAKFDPTMLPEEHLAVLVALLGARLSFHSASQRSAAGCAVAALAVDGAHYVQLRDPAEHVNALPS